MADFDIERVDEANYEMFDDMAFLRAHGFRREQAPAPLSGRMREALADPDFRLYAARAEGRFVGWIALMYMPKLGKWQGRGHVYVDELWVEPGFRRRGIARALMRKADELAAAREAMGVRLYVNTDNPAAQALYERCGYRMGCQARLMEK